MKKGWKATHRVVTPCGTVDVFLDPSTGEDGGGHAAYTREEWESTAPADYERQPDGSWTFLGRVFEGRVVTIARGRGTGL